MAHDPPRLYLVTDRSKTRGRCLVDVVDAALRAIPRAAAWVQLREKDLAGGALFRLASELAPVVYARGAALLVNDRLDVAMAAHADGVHLPESGMLPADVRAVWPDALIGASVHNATDAARIQTEGAQLIMYGPIFDTPGKTPTGIDALAAVSHTTRVHAVGGIDTPARAKAVCQRGAAGVAFIRAIMEAPDPGAAMARFYEAVR